jgi:SAM-dependent methyltransferase
MSSRYSEYAQRNRYSRSEGVQNWVAGKIVQNFLLQTGSIPSESSLLEIGAGLGRIAKTCLGMRFKSYSAIEPNPILASETRRATDFKANVVEEYLPKVPSGFEENFDLVLSFHVLEHAPDPYAAHEWVQAMLQMLKPGGYLLVSGPDIRDYKSSFWDSDWSHGYPLTPARVAQIYADLGLEIICVTSLHFGRVGTFSRVSAHLLSAIIPTRLVDAICVKVVGRPLATGVKIALLWGITFVVAKKR